MTREEAIEILQKLYEGCNKHKNTDLIKEAYNLAIEALKAQADLQPNCNELATDVISRQAAIDVEGIDEQIRCEMCGNSMHTDRGCDGNCKYDEKLYERIMQILGERIKPLPSAQPNLDRKKISDLLEKIYSIQSVHLSVEGVLARKYYCKQLWMELFGSEDMPAWID